MSIKLAGIILPAVCALCSPNIHADLDKPAAGSVNPVVQPLFLNQSRIDMRTDDPVVQEHLKHYHKEKKRHKLKTSRRQGKIIKKRKTKRQAGKIQRIRLPVSSTAPLVVNRTGQFRFSDMTRRGKGGTGRASDLNLRQSRVDALRRAAARGRP